MADHGNIYPILEIKFGNDEVLRGHQEKISEIDKCVRELLSHKKEGIKEESNEELEPEILGSIQYYNSFCIDKSKFFFTENILSSSELDVPTYSQVYTKILSEDMNSLDNKHLRKKSACFNCDSTNHSLKECSKPRDMTKINQNRQLFFEQSSQPITSKRYSEYNEEKTFEGGPISDNLKKALGLEDNQLPHFTYQMRIHGYPPGYLKEAEVRNHSLVVYTTCKEGVIENESLNNSTHIKFNTSKVVHYPGFNFPPPAETIDEWINLETPQIQLHQHESILKKLLENRIDKMKRKETTQEEDMAMKDIEMEMDIDLELKAENDLESEKNEIIIFIDDKKRTSPSLEELERQHQELQHLLDKVPMNENKEKHQELQHILDKVPMTENKEIPLQNQNIHVTPDNIIHTNPDSHHFKYQNMFNEINIKELTKGLPSAQQFANGISPFKPTEGSLNSHHAGLYIKLKDILQKK